QPKLMNHHPRFDQLRKRDRVDLISSVRRPRRFRSVDPSQESLACSRPLRKALYHALNLALRRCRQESAERLLPAYLVVAFRARSAVIASREFAACKRFSPGIFRVDARQPLAPIGQLQSNGNLAGAEIAVGVKEARLNLTRQFIQPRNIRPQS